MPVKRVEREKIEKLPLRGLPVSPVAIEASKKARDRFGSARKEPVTTWTPDR